MFSALNRSSDVWKHEDGPISIAWRKWWLQKSKSSTMLTYMFEVVNVLKQKLVDWANRKGGCVYLTRGLSKLCRLTLLCLYIYQQTRGTLDRTKTVVSFLVYIEQDSKNRAIRWLLFPHGVNAFIGLSSSKGIFRIPESNSSPTSRP